MPPETVLTRWADRHPGRSSPSPHRGSGWPPATAAGSFKAPLFTVGWPTSEFGGIGREGAVRYDVIDPADSRRWIARLFDARARRDGKHRPYVDAW